MKNILMIVSHCLLAIFLMILINGLSPIIGLIPFIGMGDLGYVVFHLLILLLTTLIFMIWISKILKSKLSDYRITKPYLQISWFVLGAVGISLMYILFMTFTQGLWALNDSDDIWNMIIVILITSLTTAISEELFFRGFLMGYIENKANIYWGVIISSIIFSVVHLMNGTYNFRDLILIVMSLFIAGVCYGLLTIYYKTIWAAVVIHFLFDTTQLFNITTKQKNQSIMEYVYESSNTLITGGQYGSTVSIITMFSFVSMTLYLAFKIRIKNI